MPSLLEALDKKYGKEEDDTLDLDVPIAIYVPKKGPRRCIPSLLVLNDCDIESAGDEDQLGLKCHGVEELDLAQNRLSRWREIFGILRQMPRIRFVNLSFNDLREDLMFLDNNNSFRFLRNLVLNGTRIDWKSVRSLLKILPSLEELHLSLNEYSHVDLEATSPVGSSNGSASVDNREDRLQQQDSSSRPHPDPQVVLRGDVPAPGDDAPCLPPHYQFTGVRRLHFTGNPITQWSEVAKLGRAFPQLESLVLADCPLESLDTGTANFGSDSGSSEESECESCGSKVGVGEQPHTFFRQLRFLNLTGTHLRSWRDIDRVSRFPQLQSLRISGCPLFEDYTEHERRQLLIARLPNVQTLNGGGVISYEEREDSERAFIRYYMDKPEADRPERYNDLVAVHGKLDPLVQIDLSPEKKVKVRVTHGESSEVRSMLVTQMVCELKQKLSSFCGLTPGRMRLFYIDQDIGTPEEMIYPNKRLYSYNIRSGDEILIDAKLQMQLSK
ncbi:tubulin-specific chaperone cofactor E-like protein isoform X1 [Schistocerca serialis cubense]|uniref:tubulin-specific chaperone cofactor E-like protein isoform X1 n=1 Tax=Schistocerca serialis cubense TaxID=2023355 RepID=UPI00214F5968|nr:tubulin-specific chaperone cofactor E-like protein isoform X1 [Schistocerca serialis cubense]